MLEYKYSCHKSKELTVGDVKKKLAVVKNCDYVQKLLDAGKPSDAGCNVASKVKVLYVVAAWKQLEQNFSKWKDMGDNNRDLFPDDLCVLVLGNVQLQKFYSPTLSPLASYFALDR